MKPGFSCLMKLKLNCGKLGTTHHLLNIIPVAKHGQRKGLERLVRVKEKLNRAKCRDIFNENLRLD